MIFVKLWFFIQCLPFIILAAVVVALTIIFVCEYIKDRIQLRKMPPIFIVNNVNEEMK